jgi:hypothetical protein
MGSGDTMNGKVKVVLEDQLKFRDLLMAHNVKGFKKFVKKNSAEFPEETLSYSNEKLSEFMHFLKTKYPYLGEHFQNSRNFFRVKQLEKEIKAGAKNEPLAHELKKNGGEPPRCNDCQYFRTAPEGENFGCVHLIVPGTTPAIPTDYACAGWTPMEKK